MEISEALPTYLFKNGQWWALSSRLGWDHSIVQGKAAFEKPSRHEWIRIHKSVTNGRTNASPGKVLILAKSVLMI